MKIVEFPNKSIEKEESIKNTIEMLKNATNFIFIYSEDNLGKVYHYDFGLNNVEMIGVLDTVKHKILHEVLPDEDDGERENIPVESGL